MVGYKRRWKNHNPNPHSTLHPKPIPQKNLKNWSLIPSWFLPRKPCVAVSTSTIISNFRSHANPIRRRHSLLLLLPCCCIWLSGPGSQDLSFRTSIFGSHDWRSQTVVIDIWQSQTDGHSRDRYLTVTDWRSQTDGRRLTVTDWGSQTDGRTDERNKWLYI
jgi:hypothetical protein